MKQTTLLISLITINLSLRSLLKPARSINYVTLNFVAVRTGVDFDEVVGAGLGDRKWHY